MAFSLGVSHYSVVPSLGPLKDGTKMSLESETDVPEILNWGSDEHFVQFYEQDDFLVQSICTFFESGLRKDDSAIVIATPEHRAALEKHLHRVVNLDAARASGQYIALDAATALAAFMVDGLPDETLFNETIGGLVRKSIARHGKLRAFGEMVAQLWAEGNADAAVQLEILWNKLRKENSFVLFCAYPIEGFRHAAKGSPFAHLCSQHTRVLPTEGYLSASNETARLRMIAGLQQKAISLEAEVDRRKRAEKASRQSQEELAADLDSITRLYEVGNRCARATAITTQCLDNIIETAIHVTRANKGILHLPDPLSGSLAMAAQKGFPAPFVRFFARVGDYRVTACAAAMQSGRRVIVEDVTKSESFVGHAGLDALLASGVRAVQSTPLLSSAGQVLGLISTHFDRPHRPGERELRLMDLLARQAADYLERKQAEETSARLTAIVEQSEDAIISKDLTGTIKTWNSGAERLFGYTADEAIGQPITLLIPPERVNEEPEILNRIRAGEPIEHYETVRRRKDGTLIDISLTVSPITDVNGKVVGASKIARDITERRRANQALRESEERLRAFFESTSVGAAVLTASSRFLEANDAFSAITGYSRDELLAMDWAALTHPDDLPDMRKLLGELALGTRERFVVEKRYLRKDGGQIWVQNSVSVIRGAGGDLQNMVVLCHDISERRWVEEHLRKRGERLQLLSETLGQLLNAREPDTIVRELFPKVAAHVGADSYFNFMVNPCGDALTLDSCAGIPDEGTRTFQRLEFGQAICGTVAQTQQPIHATDIQNSDYEKAGLIRPFGIQCYACHPLIAGGRLLGTLSFASRSRKAFDEDELQFLQIISQHTAIALERLKSAEQLENAVADRTISLRKAVEQMEEFSYTVSHDLRAPLRGMQAYAEALGQDFASSLPSDAAHYLNRIASNASRLDKMILDILAVTRLARTELSLQRINVDNLVRQIVELYPGMQPPGAHIEIKQLHDVMGHEPSLTQAISNLLNNAVKFVAPHVTPVVCISSECSANRVRLWVADNGIGINPKYQNRLFGMFERLHPDLKYEGNGVGLAIVRKTVERMGGKVGVESDGVNGSRFWIELAAAEQK